MLGSAILYVGLSYHAGQEGIYESEGFDKFDKACCSMFLFLWLLRFYVAQNKKHYLRRTQSLGELLVALPPICIVQPDVFDTSYLLIVASRYVRILLAASALTAGETLSGNEVTSQLYKMLINLTMLIVISAFLFTGIENQTLLVEIKEACHAYRPTLCGDVGYAILHPEQCEMPVGTCDRLTHLQ